MTQPNILELAKQGNPQAIAALLNRQLQPKGITTTAALQDACLQVMLEAEQVPNQRVLVDSIRKGLTGLGVTSIERVIISGRQTGEELPAWSQEFELITQAQTASINPGVTPTINPGVTPTINPRVTSPINPGVTPPTSMNIPQGNNLDLLQEFWADITERKNQDSILGASALFLSLIFTLIGFSSNSLFNFVLMLNLFLVGWILRAGYNEIQKGEKPKLIIIGGICLIICSLKIWQLSDAIAQLAGARERLIDLQRYLSR